MKEQKGTWEERLKDSKVTRAEVRAELDFDRKLREAEILWREEKQKALNPFNLRAYIKATEKYRKVMNKLTYMALTKLSNK